MPKKSQKIPNPNKVHIKRRSKAAPQVPPKLIRPAIKKWFISSHPIISVIVALIVAAGGWYALSSKSPGQMQFPTFAQTGNTTPQEFALIKSSNGGVATQALSTLAQGRLSNLTGFTVLYTGNLSAQYSIVSINSQISVADYKNGTSRELSINVSSVPGVGPVQAVYLSVPKGIYTCMNLNMSAVRSGKVASVFTGRHVMNCLAASGIDGVNFGNIANFNLTQLSQGGTTFSYNQVYQSAYRGMPCTYIAGTITMQYNGGGILQMCISNAYYVPLSLSMYIKSNQGSAALTLNETSIYNHTSFSAASSNPGPVV